MRITLRTPDSIMDEIDRFRHQITQRAFEVFDRRGRTDGHALDDWLSAEREVTWRPPTELVENDDEFLVEMALAGVPARELDVRVTPEELLVQGTSEHQHRPGETIHACEFESGRLFRAVCFPRRVDPEKARADYKDGLLRVWVPVRAEAPAAEPATPGKAKGKRKTTSIPVAS